MTPPISEFSVSVWPQRRIQPFAASKSVKLDYKAQIAWALTWLNVGLRFNLRNLALLAIFET
jgi:hypothetical protein